MALAIVLCFVANTVLLNDFYQNSKKNALLRAYERIDSAAARGSLQTDASLKLIEEIAARDSLEVLILDSDTRTILSTSRDNKALTDRLLGYFFRGADGADILYKGQNLYVQRNYDTDRNMDYMELWGLLVNDNMVFLRAPIASMEESVGIANRFLAYVGVAVILLGVVLSALFARKVSEPIMHLADISERVARLDFDAKYDGKGRSDEIAVLGHSINKMSENLEKTISELKSANNELELDIARKTRIDEMRREFLSNVSHELKTPIALIQGYAEGLRDCVNDDRKSRDEYCEVIIDEAGKMNRMVQQLLMLNELESGRDTVTFSRFDLMELISGCLQADDILLKSGGITVHTDPAHPVFVWSDPQRVEQVINNYLSNAIHYAGGDKVIDITVGTVDGKVRLNVFNTGDTIPEEALDQLWTKFYKVDKARTREYGGTGIGLSIVKAIADLLRQECGVTNYDNGVAFWFTLDADTKEEQGS